MEIAIKHATPIGCLILLLLAACDNVSWGGADIRIVPPPPKETRAPERSADPTVGPLPDGPVLYYVERTGVGAVLVPVAEIAADSLAPVRAAGDARAWAEAFMQAKLREGEEFVLFHQGARAGTFVTESAAISTEACGPAPRALGTLELAPHASSVREFVALARSDAARIERRPAAAVETTRTMRVLAPILADQLLRSRRAALPGDWQQAQAQLRPFALPDSRDPAFTATFLVGDSLGPGLDDNGHSLFFLAVPAGTGYDTAFVRFHDYANGGKTAPRVIDALDWDVDGMPELLLRGYGVNDVWFEAVGVGQDGRWRMLMADRCAPPPAALPDSTAH